MLDDTEFTEDFLAFYGEHEGEMENRFFCFVSFFSFAKKLITPLLLPFHPHTGTAPQEWSVLKFLIIGCFFWEAGTVQEKTWVGREERSQSSQTLTTRANVTSSHSSWKNVKPCTFLEESLSAWAEPGPEGPNVVCCWAASVLLSPRLRRRVPDRQPSRQCF